MESRDAHYNFTNYKQFSKISGDAMAVVIDTVPSCPVCNKNHQISIPFPTTTARAYTFICPETEKRVAFVPHPGAKNMYDHPPEGSIPVEIDNE